MNANFVKNTIFLMLHTEDNLFAARICTVGRSKTPFSNLLHLYVKTFTIPYSLNSFLVFNTEISFVLPMGDRRPALQCAGCRLVR